MRNLIPTHAEAEHIAEYLAEPLEVRRRSTVRVSAALQPIRHSFIENCTFGLLAAVVRLRHNFVRTEQVLTASIVVPHPEKVTPNSKARIHRDFGYGGEDSYYSGWGPRCGLLQPSCIIGPQSLRCPSQPVKGSHGDFGYGGEDSYCSGWGSWCALAPFNPRTPS